VALSGILSLQVDPEHPQCSGPTIADNATGMFAAYGILGALYERERSGVGRRVDVNMLEAGIAFIPDPFSNFTRAGVRSGPLTRVAASQSFAFRCGDGKLLAVHLSSQAKFFESAAAALERPGLVQDERFLTRDLRIRNYGELTRTFGEIIATKPRLHWMTVLEAHDVPFAPIHDLAEVLEDPQVRHLRTFYEQEHPTQGKITAIHRPVLIDGEPRWPSTPTRSSPSSAMMRMPLPGCARQQRSEWASWVPAHIYGATSTTPILTRSVDPTIHNHHDETPRVMLLNGGMQGQRT
jgi:crotonobetainyl-CoA:carnitine CoA-transferase CaiB-like acyl-CoA transferase